MAKTSLGKVGILPKGEYSSATQYLRLDIVSYNGSSYLCIKDCIGIDVTNKEYWLLIAQKGDKGDIGEKGEKGDAGKDFSIYKTYTSISAMESDASNVPEGEFVLIASNVEDEDNAKLYVKGENSFVYLTDLSGATGIKGEKGEKGDKPVNGVDYNTPEEKEEFKNEVVNTATTEVKQNIETIKEQAIQEFNSNASTKTNEYNDNTTTKLSEYNTNANSKVEEYNSNATQKTNTFNENATTQTEIFNNNATSKTNDFNSNYDEKLADINEASTSIEQERAISDGKYARALKTPVTDVESTQIYAENDVVNDLVVNGVELTQVVIENSPSLDNPSEVQVASEQNIIIRGNNMCKEYSNTNEIDRYATALYIEADLKPNTRYTLSLLTPNFDATYYRNEDLTSSWISFTNNGNRVKFSFTTNSDISKAYYSPLNAYSILKNNQVQSEKANFSEIMLVEGNTDLPYEPYYGTNITISLANSAIGQYADTIDRENGVQNKVIQEFIFDGTEDWQLGNTKEITQVFTLNINLNCEQTGMCNYLTYKLNVDEELFTYAGNVIYIAVNKTRASTLEEFKTLLAQLNSSGNPLKIYLARVSPTTNPLSEEVQTALSNFKLYQDLNNVAIDDGSMSFIYNKSLSKTIDEMQDEIQSKDTLIQNLTTRVEALEKAQIDNVTEN